MTTLLFVVAWMTSHAPVKPVSADQAMKLVDQAEVVVEMKVAKAKERVAKRGVVFLDSEDDFKSEKNLGVALSAGCLAKLHAQGVKDVEAHFRDKTIRVKGCVMIFETRPYMPVLSPDQIEIVERK